MPTTTYVTTPLAAAVIGARTDASGTAVADLSAEEARFVTSIFTEGLIAPATAFKANAQSTPNMSVEVGSGTAKNDYYIVTGDVGGQGNYIVRLETPSETVPVGAADASQARTDQVWLVVQDNLYDTSARALPQLAYRKGDIMSGAPAPGPDPLWKASVLLATVNVAAGVTSITAAAITDNRLVSSCVAQPNLAITAPGFYTLVYSTKQKGDPLNRHEIYADGYTKWGNGTNLLEVGLYRPTVGNILKTDNEFQAQNLAAAQNGLIGFVAGPHFSQADVNTIAANNVLRAPTVSADNTLKFTGGPGFTAVDPATITASGELRGSNLAVPPTGLIGFVAGPHFSQVNPTTITANGELRGQTLGAYNLIAFVGGPSFTAVNNTTITSSGELRGVNLAANNLLGFVAGPHFSAVDATTITASGELRGSNLAVPIGGVIGIIGGAHLFYWDATTLGTSGGLHVVGDFTCAGAKNFRIQHPLRDDLDLVHSSTESPRNGVEYWGTATVVDGCAEVELPAYFEALVRAEDRAVFVTAVVDDDEVLPTVGATRVKDGRFRIVAGPGAPAQFDVNWSVKAVRADLPELDVEPAHAVSQAA